MFFFARSQADKSRADVANLQKLLERKEIHKRPEFEPWIPVDVMDKPDREAVFKVYKHTPHTRIARTQAHSGGA